MKASFLSGGKAKTTRWALNIQLPLQESETCKFKHCCQGSGCSFTSWMNQWKQAVKISNGQAFSTCKYNHNQPSGTAFTVKWKITKKKKWFTTSWARWSNWPHRLDTISGAQESKKKKQGLFISLGGEEALDWCRPISKLHSWCAKVLTICWDFKFSLTYVWQ